MSKKNDYEKKTSELITPILEELELELYDVEYVKEAGDYFLRVYIDKADGVTIDDCVEVSRRMNEILDREDYIDDAYTFEVSSPGVERVLKKDKHFRAAIGSEIVVKLYKSIDNKKELQGILSSFDEKTLTLNIEDNQIDIDRSGIALAKMAFTF